MSEDATQDMNARFDQIEEPLPNLEEKVDRRLMVTHPVWEAVQAQLKQLNKKLDIVIYDVYETRTELSIWMNAGPISKTRARANPPGAAPQ